MGFPEELLDPCQQNITDDFTCPICQELVKQPQACSKCNKAFCTDCIKFWQEKSDICPFKCKKEKMSLIEMPDEVIMTYLSLNLKCTKRCKLFVNILDYSDHLANCDLPPCANFEECHKKIRYFCKDARFCSFYCFKKLNLTKKRLAASKGAIESYKSSFKWSWNYANSSKTFVKLDKKMARINSKDGYHTLIANTGICGGIVRMRFIIGKSEFAYKIGVTSKNEFDAEAGAFSDELSGFAVTSLGQTRNGESDNGHFYMSKFDTNVEVTVEMELNMGSGELRFLVDKKMSGPAFENVALTSGVWFPAVAVGGSVDKIMIERIID